MTSGVVLDAVEVVNVAGAIMASEVFSVVVEAVELVVVISVVVDVVDRVFPNVVAVIVAWVSG